MENKKSINITPRTPEKAEVLYRGTIAPLGHTALDSLKNGQTEAPLPPDGEQLYRGAASGVHLSSDPKTARIYADNRSFITQQKNPSASRDPNKWTVGVLNEIDNTGNELDVKVAKPNTVARRVDKWVSHYILGQTEFVVPNVPSDKTKPREVYLFRGDILHATFSDTDIAITALAGHIKYLESGGLEGEFIQQHPDPRIDRKISTIGIDGFMPAAASYVKSKARQITEKQSPDQSEAS